MATKSTECTVCLNVYNTNEYRPKILPCSHTFCKTCVHQICEQAEPTCPLCKEPIDHHDLIAITTDFSALELAENETEGTCTTPIDLKSPTVAKILSETLHPTRPDGSSPPDVDTSTVCDEGKENGTKQDLVAMLENSTDSTAVSEALLEDVTAKFSKAAQESEKIRSSLTAQYDSLKQSCDAAIQHMEADFDQIEHMIHRRRQLLKQQALDTYEEKLAEVEENLESVTLNSMRLGSLHKHSLRLLQSDTHSVQDLLQNADEIDSEMNELKEPLSELSTQQSVFQYTQGGDEGKHLAKLIRSHGRLHCVTKHE